MERLTFGGEDRHLRAAIDRRIVQRPYFQNHRRQAGPPCDQVGAARRAEFPRDRGRLIGPRKSLRRAFAVCEALRRHEHEQIGRAAGDMRTGAAVALSSQDRLALRDIAYRPAIASAFEPHGPSPASPMNMWPLMITTLAADLRQFFLPLRKQTGSARAARYGRLPAALSQGALNEDFEQVFVSDVASRSHRRNAARCRAALSVASD